MIEYRDAGAGQAIVLLHGFPQGPESWRNVEEALVGLGYRVIVPTLRGYGRFSDEPRWQYTFRNIASDIVVLLRELQIQSPIVVGHDLGAGVGLLLCANEDVDASQLIMLSLPHPAGFLKACLTSRQALKSWYFVPAQSATICRVLFDPSYKAANGARLAKVLERMGMTQNSARGVVEWHKNHSSFSSAVRWYQAMPFAPVSDTFLHVSVPTSIIIGRDDDLNTEASLEGSAKWFSDLKVRRPAGVGHWLSNPNDAALCEVLIDELRK